MYIHTNLYTCTCIYKYTYTYLYICIYVFLSVARVVALYTYYIDAVCIDTVYIYTYWHCIHMYIDTVYIRTYIYICIFRRCTCEHWHCIHMYIYMYICTSSKYTYIYTYEYMNIHIYLYTYIYICVCVCVQKCMYVCLSLAYGVPTQMCDAKVQRKSVSQKFDVKMCHKSAT